MPDSLQTHVQGREGKVSVPGQADIRRDRGEGGGSGGGGEGGGSGGGGWGGGGEERRGRPCRKHRRRSRYLML